MSVVVGQMIRFGNPLEDPVTGAPLAAPPLAFTTDGVEQDPDGVELTVQRPDETQLIFGWPTAGEDGVLERPAAGRFYADVVVDQSGTWRYFLAGSGAVNAVFQDQLRVERRRVA